MRLDHYEAVEASQGAEQTPLELYCCRWTVELQVTGQPWKLSTVADFVGTYAEAKKWADSNVKSGFASAVLAIRED
jgi:hypothetical protein